MEASMTAAALLKKYCLETWNAQDFFPNIFKRQEKTGAFDKHAVPVASR